MGPRRLAYIDALRGWAILLVILTHAAQGRFGIEALTSAAEAPRLTLPPALATVSAMAVYGVQLFFVVSALSLTLSWRARGGPGFSGVRDYLVRRFLRIAPLVYVAIAFYMTLYGWAPRLFAPNGIGIGDVALTAAFLHGWRWSSINSVIPGSWSLGSLAMFYLALPVLLLIARARWRLAALTVAGIVWTQWLQAYVAMHGGNWGPLGSFGFPAEAVVFLLGIWAAIAVTSRQAARPLAPGSAIGNGVSLALFFALVLVLPFAHLPLWLVAYRIQFAIVAALLCVALHHYPVPIVVNRATVGLGRVSFSMFVLHFALLAPVFRVAHLAVDRMAGAQPDETLLCLVYFLLLVGVSFAVASVTYVLIERPFIRLGRRLTGDLDVRSAVASVSS